MIQIKQPRSRVVLNVGRYRLMLRLTLDPFAFRWAIHRRAVLSFAFGFGMGTLIRRDA